MRSIFLVGGGRGVEHGQVTRQKIIPELESPTDPDLHHDSGTNSLIRRYRKMKG